MHSSSIIGLTNNAALLLAFGLLYDMLGFDSRKQGTSISQNILTGLLVGAVGVAIMLNHWDFGQGVVFDTRSVFLCLAGFFFGTIPVLIAVIITSVFRMVMGGAGTATGVAVIITSGGFGLIWRYLRRGKSADPSAGELYLFGLIVHLNMLGWMFLLPWNVAVNVLYKISVPVMLIHPLVTVILGKLLIKRKLFKISDEILRESEQKFKSIFRHHSAIKLIIDPDNGDIVDANLAAEEYYGYSLVALKRMRIQDLNILTPEQIKDEMEKARLMKRIHFEFVHRLADGSQRDVEVYSGKITIEGKDFLYWIINDISSRRQAEESLRNSEEYLRAMLAALPLAIISLGIEGTVRSWNVAAERMLGWTEEEVLGKIFPLTLGNQDDALAMLLHRITDGDAFLNAELTRYRKDGSAVEISLSMAPIHDKENHVVAMIAALEDITERKAAEKALKKSEHLLVEMGSIAQIGGWEHDLLNNKATWTQETSKIIEIESGEVPGPNEHLAYYPPEDRLILEKAYQKSVDTGEPFDLELQCNTANKRLFWARVIGYPEFENGKCVKMMGTFQDISEKKKMEQRLQQAQKLEAVGVLAGGIAHDFNNILTVILGFTELIRDTHPSDRQLQEDLGEIYIAGSRAKDLVQQILTFSRKHNNIPQLIQVEHAVTEALKLMRATLPASIDMQVEIGENTGMVMGSPTQLHQIVMNICTNASQAMEDRGGLLSVRIAQTIPSDQFFREHPYLQPGRYVEMCFRDTGNGIAPEILGSIFDPYFTTKKLGDGTGLGLAVTYGIVKDLGGEIEVGSKPGKGTVFTVFLPLTAAEAPVVEDVAANDYTGLKGSERILLVDDEPQILKFQSRILEQHGYVVVTEKDGLSAYERFADNPQSFDLIISDISMPGLSGDKLALRILAIRPEIPILLASGFSKNVSAEFVRRVGMQNLLQKPVSEDQLLTKIREALDAAL